jgi:hypothetical protein
MMLWTAPTSSERPINAARPNRLGAVQQQLEERVERAAHALDLLDRRVDAQLVEQLRDLRPPHRQEVARTAFPLFMQTRL